jgi:hypothetical protein
MGRECLFSRSLKSWLLPEQFFYFSGVYNDKTLPFKRESVGNQSIRSQDILGRNKDNFEIKGTKILSNQNMVQYISKNLLIFRGIWLLDPTIPGV